jgi:hypothetical protein
MGARKTELGIGEVSDIYKKRPFSPRTERPFE